MVKCPHCSSEFEIQDHYFQICFDYIAHHFPLIHTSNTSLIHQWKIAGYDFEKIVKPAVDIAVKSKKNVGLAYINSIIQSSLKEVKPITKNTLTFEKRMEIKEWKRKMGIE